MYLLLEQINVLVLILLEELAKKELCNFVVKIFTSFLLECRRIHLWVLYLSLLKQKPTKSCYISIF
jgi:hypothetical protein